MNPSDIQIGTTYRIRSWEGMVREYGKKNGNISHPAQRVASFVPKMKELCGRAYTPEKVDDDGVCYPTAAGECDTWTICAYMLEPLADAPINDNHCTDCCCAQSWKALNISTYTGKSIPEHITELREHPTLRIGRFTLSRHDAESLWIATEDGEGGQFRDEVVEEALREMYRKHNQGGVK